MSNIRVFIVDDEINNWENFWFVLVSYCKEVEIIGEVDLVMVVMDWIKELKFDLVFFDIVMFMGSGFDLFESLFKIDFDIIFVIVYD